MPDAVSNFQYKSMNAARLIALCLAPSLFLAAPPAAFEVATVKQSPPPEGNLIQINLGRLDHGKLTLGNASLSDCLKYAYGIVSDAQLAGPEWITSKDVRFDIVAQAPATTPRDQIELMLQNLLAERLKVTIHHEQRELPHIALVAAKNGPKLKQSENPTASNTAVRGHIIARNMQMRGLATLLSRFERQTIVDKTGLSGYFEFTLDWTPDDGIKSDDSGPSIFSAVQEQLGLKLESQKEPLDVLVVDHAEKIPADN